MALAIYRKYRPKSFSELVGQNHIKVTLENEIETGKIAHAYLFTGPRGIGKTTTARLFAKAVNCKNLKKAEPCNKCEFCKEIMEGRAMDLIEIDAASHTQVDNVRENIIPNARTVPSRSKYKVFIIDEVHMLSTSAFNALLKILEEPPEYVIFILATTEIHRVPETIISRCQRFDFKRVSVPDIVKRLAYIANEEGIKVEDKVLENIARISEGSIRDAESTLGQIFSLGEKNITTEIAELVLPRSDIKLIFDLFQYLMANDITSSIDLINKLLQEGVDLQNFNREFIEFLRKVILMKIGANIEFSTYELPLEFEKSLLSELKELKIDRLIKLINLMAGKIRELRSSSIPQLPLELAVIDFCEENSSDYITPINEKNLPKKETKSVKNQEDSKIEILVDNWHKILSEIKKHNHSLAMSLKVCRPLKIENEELIIACGYKFHEERLRDRKNITIVEGVIKEITDLKLKIRFIIEEIKEDTELFQKAIKTFGGEVVK